MLTVNEVDLATNNVARFYSYCLPEPMSGCWLWMGPCVPQGYGYFNFMRDDKAKSVGAHRYSYSLFKGAIPYRFDVHHKCQNPCCVNPDHLQVTSRRDHNVELTPLGLGYINSRKEFCNNGHSLSGDNLEVTSSGRRCVICRRARNRKQWMKSPTYGRKKGPKPGSSWEQSVQKTHCKHGHLYSIENTSWFIGSNGKASRRCKICDRTNYLARKARLSL